MPIALIALGVILAVSAYQGTLPTLSKQLSSDLTGSKGFLAWAAALVVVGAIGFYKPLSGVSKLFLLLILVVIVVSNKSVFQTFATAVENASGSAATPSTSSQVAAASTAPLTTVSGITASATATGSTGASASGATSLSNGNPNATINSLIQGLS